MKRIFVIHLLTLIVSNNIVFTQNFRVPIQVKDDCENSIIIWLGVDPNATSGYDPGIDSLAPPLPPGGFDARYRWLGEDYFTDIRDNELNEKQFQMYYQKDIACSPIKLFWDKSLLSSLGTFTMVDNITGSLWGPINMTTIDSLVIAADSVYIQSSLRILVTPYGQSQQHLVTTNPVGLEIIVDDSTYTSPQTFNWPEGTSHILSTISPQGDTLTRYLFDNWSDGGAITHTITAPASPTTYTATFTTEHYLTMSAGTGGTVTPSSGWRATGSSVQIQATTNSGYSFTGWTGTGNGSYTGTNNPATITMNGPIEQSANFTVDSIAAPSGLTAEVEYNPLRVVLNWQDNSNNENGFIIEREISVGEIFIVMDSVAANVTTYSDINVDTITYSYRVRAYNEYTQSLYSNIAQVTVPVELTSFTAIGQGNGVLLEWTTATETNNRGFELERRSDAGWERILFIDGAGTTTELKTYQYLDNNNLKTFSGKLSYRLKQIDFNGTYTYSNEIEVDVDFTPKEFALNQNYPNPCNPSTVIEYALPKRRDVNLIIYNSLGEKVKTLTSGLQEAGYYTVGWEGVNDQGVKVSSGMYIYSIRAGDYYSAKKMLLIK